MQRFAVLDEVRRVLLDWREDYDDMSPHSRSWGNSSAAYVEQWSGSSLAAVRLGLQRGRNAEPAQEAAQIRFS